MKYVAIFLIGFIALTFGCAGPYTFGKPIEQAKLDQIVFGKTNGQQLVSILGQPNKIEPGKSGEEKYIYYYYHDKPNYWWRLDNEQAQRLEVTVAGGVVQRMSMVGQGISEVK